jgi:hypothetical protein
MYENTIRGELERRLAKAERDHKAYAEELNSLVRGNDAHLPILIAQERTDERCQALSEALEVIDAFEDNDCFLPDGDGGP